MKDSETQINNGKNLRKTEIFIFVIVVIAGIALYFVFFAGPDYRGDTVAPIMTGKNTTLNIREDTPNLPVQEDVEDVVETVYAWTSENIIAFSEQNDSKLNIEGGDVKSLYYKTEEQVIFLRLELFDKINPELTYEFSFATAKHEPIYQLFTNTDDKLYFWKSLGGLAERINESIVKMSVTEEKKNLEIKIQAGDLDLTSENLKKLGIGLKVVDYGGSSDSKLVVNSEDSEQLKFRNSNKLLQSAN